VCCERGVAVGWLCLTARTLPRCDPRKAANQAAFETVHRGTEWGCLPLPACAFLSLFRGRGAGIAAMLRNSGGFVGLPRTIPIASATSLSEYGAVDIDMDLVFCRAAPLRGILVLAREVEVTAPASKRTVGVLQFKCVASCPWAFGCACRHWPVLVRFKLLHLT
jgi:hypothetical protein